MSTSGAHESDSHLGCGNNTIYFEAKNAACTLRGQSSQTKVILQVFDEMTKALLYHSYISQLFPMEFSDLGGGLFSAHYFSFPTLSLVLFPCETHNIQVIYISKYFLNVSCRKSLLLIKPGIQS